MNEKIVQEQKTKEFVLTLFNPSIRLNYGIFIKHLENGWEVNYHGNKIKLDKCCSRLDRCLGSDGTEFPPGSSSAFSQAWTDLSNGVDIEIVKNELQRAIDEPIPRKKSSNGWR